MSLMMSCVTDFALGFRKPNLTYFVYYDNSTKPEILFQYTGQKSFAPDSNFYLQTLLFGQHFLNANVIVTKIYPYYQRKTAQNTYCYKGMPKSHIDYVGNFLSYLLL